MSPTELVGIVLAVIGIVFAFETPRHWFLRLIGLKQAVTPARHTEALPAGTGQGCSPSPSSISGHGSTVSARIGSLTPKEVIDAVREAPLLQRDQVAKNFIGIAVDWTGYLRRAEPSFSAPGYLRINLLSEKGSIVGPSFWLELPEAQYPELKVLHGDSTIRAAGTIAGVSVDGICVSINANSVQVVEPILSTRPSSGTGSGH